MRKFLVLGFVVLLASCKPGVDNAVQTGAESSVRAAHDADTDTVMMQNGTMMVSKDGDTERMQNDVTLEDGTKITVDGRMMRPDGTVIRIEEGKMIEMDGETHMKQGGEAMDAPEASGGAMMDRGEYAVFSDAVLTNGETKVLFFHAAWCPICKAEHQQLTDWYTAEEFSRSVYRVDYDTAAELKARYGVTYQHTFVVVDGQGNMISSVQGPSDEQLRALLE